MKPYTTHNLLVTFLADVVRLRKTFLPFREPYLSGSNLNIVNQRDIRTPAARCIILGVTFY